MNEGRLIGPRVTWKMALVSGPPPTMSMWTTALMRRTRSGWALSKVVVPSISGGQMKRRVRRPRQLVFTDQLLQGAGDFEDGCATAGIVVGSRSLVIEMATENDLLVFKPGIGAGDGCSDDLVVSRVLPGADHGVEADLFSVGQTIAQGAGGFERDHEGEGLGLRK